MAWPWAASTSATRTGWLHVAPARALSGSSGSRPAGGPAKVTSGPSGRTSGGSAASTPRAGAGWASATANGAISSSSPGSVTSARPCQSSTVMASAMAPASTAAPRNRMSTCAAHLGAMSRTCCADTGRIHAGQSSGVAPAHAHAT